MKRLRERGLLAIVSGLLLSLCFEEESLSGLVWVWAIPLFCVLWSGQGGRKSLKKRKLFFWGWLAGVAFWLVNLRWFLAVGELDFTPYFAGVFAQVVLAAYLAIFVGGWALFVGSVGNPWVATAVAEQEGKAVNVLGSERASDRISCKMAQIKAAVAPTAKSEGSGGRLVEGLRRSWRVTRFAVFHAALWVVFEWLRGWLFTGFSWNGLGAAMLPQSLMVQSADLVGVAGVSFLPMLVCSMLVQLAQRLWAEWREDGKFYAHWEILWVVGLVLANFFYGMQRLVHFSNSEMLTARVMVLQENISQNNNLGDVERQLERYEGYVTNLRDGIAKKQREELAQLEEAMRRGGGTVASYEPEPIDLLVLPESAMTQNMYYVDGEPRVAMTIYDDDFLKKGLLAQGDFDVVFGSNLFEGELQESGEIDDKENGNDYNALMLASREVRSDKLQGWSEEIQTYGKVHLVPFGEYFPKFPLSSQIYKVVYGAGAGLSFQQGKSLDPLDWGVKGQRVSLIPAVCFEDTVGRLTRKFVRNEPQMIVNVTNDGWFCESGESRQHMENARFRAIELRRPMVRAANTGVSCIIDVMGRLVDEKTGKKQWIEGENGSVFVKGALYGTARVPKDGEMTLYALAGDWFVTFCGAIALVIGGMTFFNEKRAQGDAG